MDKRQKTKKLVIIAFLLALIIILQIVATYINFGFPITLTLVPIVVMGATYGIGMGAIGGLVFGVVVVVMVLTGADPSGATMMAINPGATIAACLVKGVAAGALSALAYKLISKKNTKVAIIVAAIVAPLTNTGVFYLFLILFFDADISALLGALLSVNFIIELITNVALAPGLNILVNRFKEK